jgi:hypothetical protein
MNANDIKANLPIQTSPTLMIKVRNSKTSFKANDEKKKRK